MSEREFLLASNWDIGLFLLLNENWNISSSWVFGLLAYGLELHHWLLVLRPLDSNWAKQSALLGLQLYIYISPSYLFCFSDESWQMQMILVLKVVLDIKNFKDEFTELVLGFLKLALKCDQREARRDSLSKEKDNLFQLVPPIISVTLFPAVNRALIIHSVSWQ